MVDTTDSTKGCDDRLRPQRIVHGRACGML
jgi:hypothetical protein